MSKKKDVLIIGAGHTGKTVFAQTIAANSLKEGDEILIISNGCDPGITQGIPPVEPTATFPYTNHRIDPLPEIAADGKSNRRKKRKQKRKKNK